MDGSEKELLPNWAKDAVLQSKIPQSPELKTAFLLIPAEVSFDFHRSGGALTVAQPSSETTYHMDLAVMQSHLNNASNHKG